MASGAIEESARDISRLCHCDDQVEKHGRDQSESDGIRSLHYASTDQAEGCPLRQVEGFPRKASWRNGADLRHTSRLQKVGLPRRPPSDNKAMSEAIIRDPEIMSGTPVFKGTRVPLQNLFDYLEGGEGLDDFLEGFPTVSRALAIQALEEAKELLLTNV